MQVTFSNNPIDRLSCDISNWILKLKHKRWHNGLHSCICHVCGKTLISSKDEYCPEECGWMKLRGRNIYNPWICHGCLEHHDDLWIRKEQ